MPASKVWQIDRRQLFVGTPPDAAPAQDEETYKKRPHPELVEGWPRAGTGPSTRRLRRLLRMRRLKKNLILSLSKDGHGRINVIAKCPK
jgi:hypothetical protein